jgi:hypothetical protein
MRAYWPLLLTSAGRQFTIAGATLGGVTAIDSLLLLALDRAGFDVDTGRDDARPSG